MMQMLRHHGQSTRGRWLAAGYPAARLGPDDACGFGVPAWVVGLFLYVWDHDLSRHSTNYLNPAARVRPLVEWVIADPMREHAADALCAGAILADGSLRSAYGEDYRDLWEWAVDSLACEGVA